MSRSRKRRPKADHRRIVAVLCGLLGVAAAALAFAVEHYGGQGVLPTWGQLYDMLGVADNAPDAEIVASGQTSVTFLDVGQGDSVLICQDGEFCLIDAGTPDSADSLVAALRAAGVDELAYLVMTHPHADHIGGMPQVLESFDTGLLILPDLTEYDEESSALDRTLAAAADNGVPMYVALDGDTFALGGGTLTVLQAGEQPQNEGDAIEANNLSLCLRYTAGSFAFVDTGDAEADLEEQLVSRCGAGLQADLLKAGDTMGCLPYILVALLISGLMAGLFGLIIGIPALRLKGDYLAIITLGFGEIIRVVLTNIDSVLGFKFTYGASGLKRIP